MSVVAFQIFRPDLPDLFIPGLFPSCRSVFLLFLGALGLLEALKNIKMSLANKVQDQSQYPFRPATNSILFALL